MLTPLDIEGLKGVGNKGYTYEPASCYCQKDRKERVSQASQLRPLVTRLEVALLGSKKGHK